MNKICTDISQSKKLIELGIDINTADMWYINGEGKSNIGNWSENQHDWDDIPAWSLSALLGLMPNFTLNGFGNGQFNCRGERADCYALVNTCPLDAVFEMVVKLKENNYL